MMVSYSVKKKVGKRNVKFRRSATISLSLICAVKNIKGCTPLQTGYNSMHSEMITVIYVHRIDYFIFNFHIPKIMDGFYKYFSQLLKTSFRCYQLSEELWLYCGTSTTTMAQPAYPKSSPFLSAEKRCLSRRIS